MSQEKVNRYKEEKANRKETMKKQKRAGIIRNCIAGVVLVAAVAWVGYSGVTYYIAHRPRPEVEVNNRRRRNETYAHLLNRNFDGGDTAVVLSISDDFYASVTDDIWAYIDRFVDRLEYRARKHGEKPKMTIIVGISEVGRIHAHALISKNIKTEWIISAWVCGYVFTKEASLTDGSFQTLANYFMNNADRYKNSSRRSAYKNIGMCSVPTIKEEITKEEMFSSSCYDGYRKNHSQCYYGINDYGNAYSHNLYVKVDGQETNDITFAKTAGQDTGCSDGYIDGYNSYFNGTESCGNVQITKDINKDIPLL